MNSWKALFSAVSRLARIGYISTAVFLSPFEGAHFGSYVASQLLSKKGCLLLLSLEHLSQSPRLLHY
jgi:hypothetical protein